MRPTSWSCWPLITCRSSSVSLPHFSLTVPANCLQLPSTLSQFMCTLPMGLVNVSSAGQRARPRGGCPVDFPLCFVGTIHHITHRRTGAGERHRGGRSLNSMLKDDIVALLPDLRAFARFMCREREAADDLVQNTVLAALDKQGQFAPGTNLKGWLFTIMRNRFYSDLRTQRRRPSSIDEASAAPIAAVDNPEASLELKELSVALWRLSPQAREALIL